MGAHRGEVQQAPSLAAFEQIQDAAGGHIGLLTLAPEWEGSAEFIAEITRAGVGVLRVRMSVE